MITRKAFASASALYNIFFFPFASSHMEMSWPYPLRSKFDPANSYQVIDYSMTAPLSADGSNFPCKGYQNDRPVQTTTSYTAGFTYNMTLAGSATHGGGSCQLSLSYDNGATFRVIKSMIGGCPLTSTYEFTIPSYAPAGVALFAWTWQNYEGNREFYMNCAEVNIISGGYSGRRKRQAYYSSFGQLPYIWRANLEGINDCVTTEQEDPVYPNPGPDVAYGDGLTSDSAPSPGTCDASTPYGQAYQDLSDSSQPAESSIDQLPASTTTVPTSYPSFSYSPQETSSTAYPTFSYEPLPIPTPEVTSASYSSEAVSFDSAPYQRVVSTESESYSTTTITIDCPATVTMTVYPSAATTSTITLTPSPTFYTTVNPACTGTSASCPCASNYQCQELDPCTWACNAYITATTLAYSTSSRPSPSPTASTRSTRSSRSTLSSRSTWSSHSTWSTRTSRRSHSTVVVTTTHTVTPIRPTSSARPAPTGHPPYATGDPNRYLPCVPGTFICTDDSSWDTCNYPDGSDPDTPSNRWEYGYPRNVSAGMECITFLSPYSSETNRYAQQALTPNGYFRDDRIVRARPDGDCDDDGSLKCIDGGQQFEICDQGGWVLMGPVANGTTCVNGEIVASG